MLFQHLPQIKPKPFRWGEDMPDTGTPQSQINMPKMLWIDTRLIKPHPRNPRHADRAERREAIINSMRDNGFWMDKPLVVRLVSDSYEAIGGNTRLGCAIAAGLSQVYCSVWEMSDEEAIIRIAEDNLGDPFNWAEQCVYVAQNAIKDSKQGLSRSRLVQACTGKTGDAARSIARIQGQVGELLLDLLDSQSVDIYTLFNSAKSYQYHLYEVCALGSRADREWLVQRLIAEGLTVEAVRSVAQQMIRPQVTHFVPVPAQPLSADRPHSLPAVQGIEHTQSPAATLFQTPSEPIPLSPAIRATPKTREYNPIDILTMELNASVERVELLEKLIYELFNAVGSAIPQKYLNQASMLGVFDFKHRELQELNHA